MPADMGRFASNYRAIYGELRSATLRRGSSQRPLLWGAAA
jgi:hypothetical protein